MQNYDWNHKKFLFLPDSSSGLGLGMDLKVCEDLLDLSGDLYLCKEGLSLFLIFRVDFVPGPARASTTWKQKNIETDIHYLKNFTFS